MRNIFLVLALAVIFGCSAESSSPQVTFSFPASKENSIEAREVLRELAIENNLMFEDGSRKFPGGTATTIAVAERMDGLKLVLLGAPEMGKISIAVHCHEGCEEWQGMYQVAKARFAKHWEITE